MVKILKEYRRILSVLPRDIKKSYYKSDFFINQLDLKPSTFYRKLKDGAFTLDEVEKIYKILHPEDFILDKIEESKAAYERGEYMTSSEVRKSMKEKYFK